MRRLLPVLTMLLFVIAGAAVVIIVDKQGWMSGAGSERAAKNCPHGMTSEKCPFCNKALIETMGFCAGHGVAEALCTRCNPALIAAFKVVGDWCAEHNIPESQCTICNPGILDSKGIKTNGAPPVPSVQLIRTPELRRSQRASSVTCNTSTLRVQFLSPEIARATGFEYARVESRKITETILCNAEVVYDASLHARLSSRTPGIVQKVSKDLGEPVAAGETLAIVDSSELGTAKADYLQAQALTRLCEKNDARQKRLMESNVATERDVLESETKLTESRITLSKTSQRLRNLGLSDDQLQMISKERDTSSLLPLRAPFQGIVVGRSAVVGEVVDSQTPLFSIADTSKMWAMLDIYESDIPRVRNGQAVVFQAEGLPGEQCGGRVTWVSSHVERRTRTLKVRAEIANSDGLLRSGMFGKATIAVRKDESALVVPKDSVQWEGCCNIVFVKRSDVLFEPCKVKLGYETDRFFVVEDGLDAGEEIVTVGSFLLKTEIMKGSIGAGCCEVEPGKEQAQRK